MPGSKPFFCLMVVFLPTLTFTQEVALHPYTHADGLLSEGVNSLLQDSRGYLWIGTNEGLSIFDGRTFVNYTPSDGLALNYVTTICESRKRPGHFLIGTLGGGISQADLDFEGRLYFKNLLADSTQAGKRISNIIEDTSGTFWVNTEAGLFRIVGDSITRVRIDTMNPVGYELAATPDGEVIVGVRNRIVRFRLHGKNVTGSPLLTVPTKRGIRSLFYSSDARLWVSTYDSLLLQYADTTLLTTRRLPAVIFTMTEDGEGNLWAAARNGLFKLPMRTIPDGPIINYESDDHARFSIVTSLLFDSEQNLWIAGNGLNRWTNRSLVRFSLSMGHVYNGGSATKDRNNHLWIAAKEGLAEIWQGGDSRWRSHLHQIRIDGRRIIPRSLNFDHKGALWMYCSDNKYRSFEIQTRVGPSTTVLNQTIAGIFPKGGHHGFIVDKFNLLWCSIQSVGVAVVQTTPRPKLLHVFTNRDGLPDQSVRVLYEDQKGRVLLSGFFGGVSASQPRKDGHSWPRTLDSVTGLSGTAVRSMVEDETGRLWLGTRHAGLITLRDATRETLTVSDGLISNALWSIADGGENDLWLGTARGFQLLNKVMREPGMPLPDFIGPAIYSCGSLGNFVWYTTGSAVTIFSRPAVFGSQTQPPIHLTGLSVDGKDVHVKDELEFAYNENTFTFHLTGVSFSEDGALGYRYRLIGLDNSWHLLSGQSSVTYGSVPSGRYTFEAKAVRLNGIESASPTRVSFKVRPPFWNTWWFGTASALTVVFLGMFVYRKRIESLNREKSIQEEMARRLIASQEMDRRRIAGGLHDSLGQNLLILKNGLDQATSGHETSADRHQELRQLSELAQQSLNEVREISFDLHPHVLDRLGLRRAIEAVIEKMTHISSVSFSCSLEDLSPPLAPEVEINLYRIVQEALSNVVKYSGAASASVQMTCPNGQVNLEISDNGKGFDVEEHLKRSPRKQSLGLLTIAERAALLGGTHTIRSKPGEGTIITISVPTQLTKMRE